MAKYDTQLNRLEEDIEEGTIDPPTGQLLREYIEAKVNEQKRGETAETTVKNHIFYLRKVAARSDVPLAEAPLTDVRGTLKDMNTGSHPDVKNSGIGIGNYQATLRVFYRFHPELGIDPEEIDIEHSAGRDLSPEDLLYREDVDALLAACYGNDRDRAFISLSLATAQRLDALRTLRIKHVDVGPRTVEITLNETEGALKGAKGAKPLLWAKHYLKEWLKSHPFGDDPEAALFVPLPKSVTAREDVDPREPMHPSSFRRILDNRAALAGLTGSIYPHLLRHSGLTRMASEGLTREQMRRIAGTGKFETYINLADQLNNDSVRETLGMPTSGSDVVVGKPTVEECICGEQYPADVEVCPTCGAGGIDLDEESAETPDQEYLNAADAALAALSRSTGQDVDVLIDNLNQNLEAGNLLDEHGRADVFQT